MAELVDARDLKSLGPCDCESSILSPGTIEQRRANTSTLEGISSFLVFGGLVEVLNGFLPTKGPCDKSKRDNYIY